jgi:hypothetical protein
MTDTDGTTVPNSPEEELEDLEAEDTDAQNVKGGSSEDGRPSGGGGHNG